jgi:hypothetical protein
LRHNLSGEEKEKILEKDRKDHQSYRAKKQNDGEYNCIKIERNPIIDDVDSYSINLLNSVDVKEHMKECNNNLNELYQTISSRR